MRKEVLVAILLGFGIGLVVTLGIFTARKALKTAGGQTPGLAGLATPSAGGEKLKSSPSPQIETEHIITVTTPSDGSVGTAEKITLAGATTGLSVVAITGGETDTVTGADEKGQFSTEITLIGGDNQIRVVSFSPKGETAETILTVVYSTAEF